MKFQTTNWSCGPAAVVNALRCLGIKVTEWQATKFTQTTKAEGTDTHGIVAALWALGAKNSYSFDEDNFPDGDTVAIIVIRDWSHWVVLAGKVGDNYLIIDSGRTKSNRKENGVHVVSEKQLIKLWKHSREKCFSGVYVF